MLAYPAVKPAPGTVIGGRFRLERRLDEGGMGEVWRAEHLTLGSPCAVKVLLQAAQSRPDAIHRFEREAQAAARLRSPYVVQILDYGVEDGTPYIAMEYLEGESLLTKLKRSKRLSPQETCRWVDDVARALEKAHKAGVIHRDLKPGNIFLEHDEDGVRAKVLDFGVAKKTGSVKNLTQTGTVLGTPYYMSPEQAMRPAEVDHRADLWSLAVIVYRCLTGKRPFPGKSMGDLVTAIMGDPPVPSEHAPFLPRKFDAWFRKGVRKDPDQRFDDARSMAEQLRRALSLGAPSRPSLPSIGAAADPWLDDDATRKVQRPSPDDVKTKASRPSDASQDETRKWKPSDEADEADEATVRIDADERTIEMAVDASEQAPDGARPGPHWRSLAVGMLAAGGLMLGYQALTQEPASGVSPLDATAAPTTEPLPEASPTVVSAVDAPPSPTSAPAAEPEPTARPSSTFRLPPAVPQSTGSSVPSAEPSATPEASASAPEPAPKYGDYGF